MKNTQGILLVVSGFSGAGKGTVMKKLMETYDNYALSISTTTRNKRQGEEHGKDYFFVETKDFEEKIAKNQMIEYAKYCDNYYGTPREYVEEMLSKGKDVILEIEIQGALKVKEIFKDALLLFIMPPNAEELRTRLVGRGTETLEVINKRLKRAVEESEGIEKYDYIVINDQVEACVERIHQIIDTKHMEPICNREFVSQIREELKHILKGE